MEPSQKGLELTKTAEGLRLKAYQDTGGVWTIGYGHTGGVKPNDVITPERAEELLRLDRAYAVKCVNDHALPCTQGQFDALVDFVFNIGPSQFLSSTLLKRHLAGRYEEAAAEFPKWKYDNGKVIRGLIVRRAAEQALYNLQEPEADRQQTDVPEYSVPSAAYPVPQDHSIGADQSSQAPSEQAERIPRESRSTPAGLLSRALALLRKMKAEVEASIS